MSRAPKLTPGVRAQIVKRRHQGASYAAIASELGLSEGSVGNALREAGASRPRRGSLSTPSPSAGPPSLDPELAPAGVAAGAEPFSREELLADLTGLYRSLSEDAKTFRRDKNQPAVEATNRALVQLAAHLARLAPEPPRADADDYVLFPAKDARLMAAEVSERLHKMIDQVVGMPPESTCEECSRRAHALPAPPPPPPVSNRRIA